MTKEINFMPVEDENLLQLFEEAVLAFQNANEYGCPEGYDWNRKDSIHEELLHRLRSPSYARECLRAQGWERVLDD